MKVLSLFDGISCGMVALERAEIPVKEYHAWEIDRHAIQISQKNYPNIKQHGDVKATDFTQYHGCDLLIGGSPCQGFSSSGKGLNFDDPRSRLFFEFVRAMEEAAPRYFLLENVNMKKEWRDIITQRVGVEPIFINSALVSAQNRQRLYWTNIPGITVPADKGVRLQDILEDVAFANPGAIRGRRLNKATITGRRIDANGRRQDQNKSIPVTQCLEVRDINTDKSNCLTTVDKDNVLTPLPPGRYPDAFKKGLPFRYYTTKEYERLQTLPDGYTEGVPETKRRKAIGNAWTVDAIAHIFTGLKNNEKKEANQWQQQSFSDRLVQAKPSTAPLYRAKHC